MKKRDEEIKNITEKLKDPNTSEEDRKKLEQQLGLLIAQQDEDKREKDVISSKLKELGERIKNNNRVISNTTSNLDDRH
jgi:hypothetical protein